MMKNINMIIIGLMPFICKKKFHTLSKHMISLSFYHTPCDRYYTVKEPETAVGT